MERKTTMKQSVFALMLLAFAYAHGAQESAGSPSAVGKGPYPGFAPGYLSPGEQLDSKALLPPPPAAGSPAQAADEEAKQAAAALRGTPRWQRAGKDAELMFPKAADTFSCALGLPIDEATSPNLTMLLRRSLVDAGFGSREAKHLHQRARPFMAKGEPTCTPDHESYLRKDGSYPSGHAAIGWAWGLILAELAPERANALVQRGYEFGESRRICNVHWASDVAAGRLFGSAVVARLHANTGFVAQLAEAKREVAAARAAGLQPKDDCAAEAKAFNR